eukprot:TRINITY_DN21573_c0_g1_i1.p1 TRINITY_DN21573_c0_g1~~TRINITY_DN21573_c0_g1_i1.p1  ORF type:complete len:748 (+),score=43.65 TRINITY_DN21573_c0_g1_i1:210-2246(+)
MGAQSLRRSCVSANLCYTTVVGRPSISGSLGVVEHARGYSYPLCTALMLCFVLIGVVWLYTLAQASVNYIRKLGVRRLPEAIYHALAFLRFAKHSLLQDPLDDLPAELRKRGHQLLQDHRLERFRKAAMWVFFVLPIPVAWSGWESVKSWIMVNFDFGGCTDPTFACSHRMLRAVRWQTEFVANSTGTVLLLLCCMAATLRSQRLSGTNILATHIAVYVGCAVHLFELVDLHEFQTTQGSFAVIVRAAVAIIDGRVWSTIVLNAGMTFLHILVIVVFPPLPLPEGTQHIRESVLYSMIICLATVTVHWTRYNLVRQLLLVDKKSEEAATVKGMLDLMCDAVCELTNCRIPIACPKLAALTMRSGPEGLQGRAILDLVCQEDRERFSAALSNRLTRCSMIHVRMLDVVGGLVPVQVFVALQGDLDTTLRHVIGIREEAERGMLTTAYAPHADSLLPEITMTSSCPAQDLSASDGELSEQSQRSRRKSLLGPVPETCSVTSAFSVGSVVLMDLPEAWPDLPLLWLRRTQEGDWVIVKASRCFANAVGQSSMKSNKFHEWMLSAKMQETWFSFAMKVLESPHDKAGATCPHVKLKPPALDRMSMTCAVTFLFAEDHGTENANLLFMVTNIRLRSIKKKTRQDRFSQTPPLPPGLGANVYGKSGSSDSSESSDSTGSGVLAL